MLQVGTKAPDFTLPDQNGNTYTLSEFKGKVLLYFYPKDNTSGCTMQAKGYSEALTEFTNKNVTVLGVSKDSVSSHKRFCEKQDLKITLLSDESLDIIKAYDVWKEKKLYGNTFFGVVRTTYLIDETGTIIFASDKVKAAADAETMLKII